jgi:hypothetical protein
MQLYFSLNLYSGGRWFDNLARLLTVLTLFPPPASQMTAETVS